MHPRIKSKQELINYFGQMSAQGKAINPSDLFLMRKACYADIKSNRENRPLLVYATKFIQGNSSSSSIDLSDIEGFTDIVNSIKPEYREVDILLHSPGGAPDATERIVHILRNRFDKIHFLIPHSAYSAATMLALSGNSITLHPSATLGPIDPQINGIPARSIKNGFEKVRDIVKEGGPEALPPYIPLIEKYELHLLELCDDFEELSVSLVKEWMTKYMFEGDEGQAENIRKAAEYFSEYDTHKIHSRPLFFDKVGQFNLKISESKNDDPLTALLWEAFILLETLFEATSFCKIYENSEDVSWGRQSQQMMFVPQAQQQGQFPQRAFQRPSP